MVRFFYRIVLVTVVLVAMFLLLGRVLTRDVRPSGGVDVNGDGRQRVEAVTIEQVIESDIPSPTLSKVSFAEFTYKQAFPGATDEAEVVIGGFVEAPMLADMSTMPADWRKHYPESLPPVAERLPRNPAVVRGPDGIGRYGGTWHRVQQDTFAWDRPIMYETFIRNGPGGKQQPGVAYRWEMSENNRVFTFYMRKGHRWSDGQPFTSHDIAWICNVLIGGPYWLNLPFWMQGTDGSAAIYIEDILDWGKLARTILDEADSDGPTPGKQMFALPTPNPAFEEKLEIALEKDKCERLLANQEKIRTLLEKIAGLPTGEQPGEILRNKLIDLINRVLKNRNYFESQAWSEIDFDSELKELNEIGVSRLNPNQLERYIILIGREDMAKRVDELKNSKYKVRRVFLLNNLAFRAAYPKLVKPAAKTRVKIEPIADENGDDSHIIRFTFPKPSSFFLEKTSTFMFYRGLFVIAPHFVKKLHPDGSDKVEVEDIYDWAGLISVLVEAGDEANASACGQLWKLLPDTIREQMKGRDSKDELSDGDKQQIVDAINQAFASREFYDPAFWSEIDFDSELARLLAREGGFNEIVARPKELRRFKELSIRADMLKRVTEEGVQSLNDEQLQKFNQFMFRAALDDPVNGVGYGLVATNREAALNHRTITDEKPYESWLAKMHALRRNPYHPIENPHMPTLKAWRIVTERSDVRSVAVRNPYYYRVDELGKQLPYLDAVETTREADREARMLKMCSGSVDFQCYGVEFSDYTVLKQNEADGDYEVRLWGHDTSGRIMLFSNFKHDDPLYEHLQKDPRFRYALSSAINRKEIIEVVFSGLGEATQYSIPKGSPYYNEKLAKAYIEYDPELANRLLDEMGYDKRASDGTRLVPVPTEPGELQQYKPLIYVVYTEEKTVPIQAIEMICSYWQKIGINAQMKLTGKIEYLSNLGLLDAAAREGGGSFYGPLHAGVFAPTHGAEGPHWGGWVNYIRSNGQAGNEPPDWVMDRERVWNKVVNAENDEQKYGAWQELMDDNADLLPVIGILNPPGKVVIVKNNFKNVPKLAIAGTIPHAPGNSCPEAYYFSD